MKRRGTVALLVFLIGCGRAPEAMKPEGPAVLQQPGLTMRLPVHFLDMAADGKPVVDKLAYTDGAEDEPPQGPGAFDVSADGSVTIADPLQRRTVTFNAQGGFVREQALGFAVDQVVLEANGAAVVRRAADGVWQRGGGDGQAAPDPRKAVLAVKMIAANRAFAAVPGAAESEGLAVEWQGGYGALASVEVLERDGDGNWLVALEVMEQDLDTVQKMVRKYGRGGKLLAEVKGISTDYYYAPQVEFRVRNGVVYQLEPLPGEVRINGWDLAGFK